MNKSTKIISSLAALGALCVGTAAMASPWHNGNCPGAGVPEAQCPIAADGPRADGPRFNKPSRQVDPAVRAARWDAIARMLTIKPEQEAAWKAYTAARDAERTPIAKTDDKKLAVDVQTRLQLRADRAKVRADLLAKSAQARADLLNVLSPEQKYVLEGMEFHHGARMMDRGPYHKGSFDADRGPGPRGPMNAAPCCQ